MGRLGKGRSEMKGEDCEGNRKVEKEIVKHIKKIWRYAHKFRTSSFC